jgi:hypothetical protein
MIRRAPPITLRIVKRKPAVSPDVSVDAPDTPDGAPGQALKAKATKVGYATGLTNLIDDEEGATFENRDRKKMSDQVNRFDYFADARK